MIELSLQQNIVEPLVQSYTKRKYLVFPGHTDFPLVVLCCCGPIIHI